jgi:hypothetical protein
MGSGGGGGIFSRHSPDELKSAIRDSQQQAVDVGFETSLTAKLNDLLSSANSRDVQLVKTRLDNILDRLEQKTGHEFEVEFAGSVAKHTYVDGLSDIDTLLLVDETALEDKTPAGALKYLETRLQKLLAEEADVAAGSLAIHVTYKKDGLLLQLLPALKTDKEYKIASEDGKQWTQIEPKKFLEHLTANNQKCEGKLVPTIKLVKAINAQLPEKTRMKGYHIEALAIEAFKNYEKDFKYPQMLQHFFSFAAERVNAPIVDKTGQSIHVDEYLGSKNSDERKQLGHLLTRIERRMKNATAGQVVDQWLELFGE